MSKTSVGALSVEITADTDGVKKGIGEANSALKDSAAKLRSNANAWGKWAAAASVAAAGIAAALVKSNLGNIRELKNLSDRANVTVADFQRMAFGAKQFGIDQDKLSDILLDFNDRVGDFVTTGAGPMVDFFEQIGPKVGVTIDDFQKLSGKEGLQLYVNSLEKANLNQQEMTFFMEAIASDSTNLLPLLKNNGKAMTDQAKAAKALGIGLSDIDVEKAAEAQRQLDAIESVLSNEMMKATAELAPVVSAIAKSFLDVAKESGGFAQYALKGFRTVGNGVAVLGDGIHGLRVVFKGLQVIGQGIFAALASTVDKFTGGSIREIGRSIADFAIAPMKKLLELMAPFSDMAANALKQIDSTLDNFLVKPKQQLGEFAQAAQDGFEQAKAELHNLATEELPTQSFNAWLDEIEANAKETAASIQSSITGGKPEETGKSFGKGSGAEANSADKERERNQSILEALIEAGTIRSETIIGQLEHEKMLLDNALADKLISEQDHARASIDLQEKTTRAKNQIAANGFEAAAQALSVGGKKAQKIAKKLAIVGAVIKGKQAAVDAWQAGMSTGGPYAPLVAAAYTAASLAQTGSIIKSINSSGSSTSVSKGSTAIPNSPTGGGASPSQSGQEQQSRRFIDVNFQGEGVLSTDQVRALMGQINEQLGDGVTLNVGG